MQITSKFTIAIHIITAIDYFGDTMKVTSSFLAGSVGANPVIVRNVMGNLKAVECVDDRGLFHFHENPSIRCPVGRNIHRALDGKLRKVQDAMEAELRRITVADVESDIRKEVAAGH